MDGATPGWHLRLPRDVPYLRPRSRPPRPLRPPRQRALGGLSNPDEFGAIATQLSNVFPDFQLEVFEQRHHFDPPHRIEPERLAASLHALWSLAEAPI